MMPPQSRSRSDEIRLQFRSAASHSRYRLYPPPVNFFVETREFFFDTHSQTIVFWRK